MRAWLILLLLAPIAAGQGHEHEGSSGFVIASDSDGFAYVGSPVHFELIAFGDDHIPDFHQDLPVRVTLDGDLLYETTTVSGHDYDGVHGFDIVFPWPGEWEVAIMQDGEVVAAMTGETVQVDRSSWAGTYEGSGPIIGSASGEFIFDTTDGWGGRANHTDMLLEVFQDGRTVLRTQLHIHNEPVKFQYKPDTGPSAAMQITRYTAFPQPDVAPLAPASVAYNYPGVAALPLPAEPIPETLPAKNAVETVSGEFDLVGTYDPFTQVGPDTLQQLNVLVLDDGKPVPHVDFEATLTGPPGLIFHSSSLHEYDGIYTLATRQQTPGQYNLDVTASRGSWSQDIQLTYYVLPPAAATLAGPQTVTMAPDAAEVGVAKPISWTIGDAAGRPFAHGEVDLRIIRPGDQDQALSPMVYVRDKLHTHAGGNFDITYNFPQAGQWPMLTDPYPLDPQPVGPFTYNTVQTAAGYTMDVTGERTVSQTEAPQPTEAPAKDTPLPLMVVILALAIALARRQA